MLYGGMSLLEPRNTSRFDKPLFLFHGTGDLVTSHLASCRFFEAIPSKDKTHKEYEGVYHDIHNDIGREVAIEDCKQASINLNMQDKVLMNSVDSCSCKVEVVNSALIPIYLNIILQYSLSHLATVHQTSKCHVILSIVLAP